MAFMGATGTGFDFEAFNLIINNKHFDDELLTMH